MKTVKAIVLDSRHLQLEEDAKEKDIIDLSTIAKVDFECISNLIEKEKNAVLDKKIKEARESFDREQKEKEKSLLSQSEAEKKDLQISFQNQLALQQKKYQDEINKLNTSISVLMKEKEVSLNNTKLEIQSEYKEQILKLTMENEKQKENYEKDIDNLKEKQRLELENQKRISEDLYKNQIKDLQNKLENQKNVFALEKQSALDAKSLEWNQKYADLNTEYMDFKMETSKQKEKENLMTEEKLALERKKAEEYKIKYDELFRQKSSLNVKTIGENLESWCNDAYRNIASLGGFENCTWEKDNQLVKGDFDDSKAGTKADFIFRAYSSDEEDKVEITSCCMDMKSENPDSTNRKKNSDYFKKLNDDRIKKKCEYALLVSELEMKSDNDVPIYKVGEYENMYVVRPQYFLTFLGILMNLGKKYADLIRKKVREDEKFKTSEQLKADFEDFKRIYLDTPLLKLNKQIADIKKSADTIVDQGQKILDNCASIIDNTLENMKTKIDTLSIKMNKVEKQLDKLNS